MVAPLIAVATATAVMTLRSDTKPVTVYVKSPKGTLYWGGAGLDGDYITPTLTAFRNAGIKNISVGLTNTATRDVPKKIGIVGTFVDAIRAGLIIRYEDDSDWTISTGMSNGEQFNLIGYSYGSLLAAQTANFYAKNGITVNNLVLIASPIDADFLKHLKNSKNIKKVTVLNIKGDDIYAGITQIELINPMVVKKLGDDMQANKGQGHFYFAHSIPDLPLRLQTLAEQIVSTGVK
jgi:hypothetical protein